MTNLHRIPTDLIACEEDATVLRAKYERLKDQHHDLKQFTLELLRRHPEELLFFQMYSDVNISERNTEPQRRAAETRKRRAQTAQPVVYYLSLGDRVKIGTSRSIMSRLQSLHAAEHDLLCIEPGGSDVESAIHATFKEDHIDRELFRKSDALMSRIRELRLRYPDPLATAKSLNGLVA